MKDILRPCIIVGFPDIGNESTLKYLKIQGDLTSGSFKPVTLWEGDRKYLGFLFIDSDVTKMTLRGLETVLETQLDSWYLDESRNVFKGPLRSFIGALVSDRGTEAEVVVTIVALDDTYYVVNNGTSSIDTIEGTPDMSWPLFM